MSTGCCAAIARVRAGSGTGTARSIHWLIEDTGEPVWSPWYTGRPMLVTTNDYGLKLYNGDTGVAVLRDGTLRAVIADTDGPVEFATAGSPTSKPCTP